jgi:L-aminopeptidase/D-esterase-like protein
VLLTGGSAFGLAAADGVVRWLERRGLGRPTPVGVIPLVPTAVVFHLVAGGGDPARTRATPPARRLPAGYRGAGGSERAGAVVGKVFGRERATQGGVGYAATRLVGGETLSAIAVANASGDVIGAHGEVLGGPHGDRGELLRSAALIPDMPQLTDWATRPGQSTTLACVCTDAALDQRGCGIVARIASAGIARAVDPAFTPWTATSSSAWPRDPDRPLRRGPPRHGRSRSWARSPRPSRRPRFETPYARPA